MDLILKAFDFAKEKHLGQVRKVSNLPYITHPIAVSYIVAAYKTSKKLNELIVASFLHDTLEDTETTFIEIATIFGPLVASLVQELTNDEDEIQQLGKLAYHQKKLVAISSYALVIKLADRLHNISDSPTEKMVKETIELMNHLRKNRKLTKTHKNLVNAIEERCAVDK